MTPLLALARRAAGPRSPATHAMIRRWGSLRRGYSARPYADPVLECVANVSEGRDRAALRAIAEACGPTLVDVHADADHHRAVFTLAGTRAEEGVDAPRRLGDAVAARVSIVGHVGVHPFIGALDVVPFVALGGDPGAAV